MFRRARCDILHPDTVRQFLYYRSFHLFLLNEVICRVPRNFLDPPKHLRLTFNLKSLDWTILSFFSFPNEVDSWAISRKLKSHFRTRRHAVGSQDDPGSRCVRLVQQDVPPEEAGGRPARDANEEMSLHLRHHAAR